ncbi:unnamed protein product [Heligmosomoides polygyrus]|uniref:DNA primase small subunit n=1 Tax=Heligmosomoides polygyrus TaxID=6339 RepID=A0A183GRD2_HELPZ|nr:unnamed protein product [Heligmosomoides polygyrus]
MPEDRPLYWWLLQSGDYFARREFAFILDEDVHLRYRCFADQAEFEQELCKINPHKLDIGAVYSHKPKENKKHSDFKALERELVFDIDLTDYDNVHLPFSCLPFQLDHFGFKARMWVFSGRRGVHCWVGDEKARKLTNAGRSAVAEYLSLIVVGSTHSGLNHLLKSPFCIHPKTGNVAVPLDVSKIREFDVTTCPRFSAICWDTFCLIDSR